MNELAELIRKSKDAVAAMKPSEREAMMQAQRESWARSMKPCEHGMVDWEDCQDCRAEHGNR